MADVPGKFFSATKVRTGVSPSSAGSLVGETLPPVNPPGSSLNSVGLTMPSAFTVANSPLTSNGTIGVTGAGTVGQYIRGDGSLADFPESSGGGSSVSYYLNGSISQGTIGGVAYKELNKVPVLGAGTNFTINADGYIAQFLTDAGDPHLLEIAGGNWNFETYFSASSMGGTPSFYVELYKYDGTTFTLIASSSSAPEFIAFGTITTPYFSSLAVPTTALTLTDRLAVRFYVTHSGRTITLHTENNTLCQIVTTFTTGLTSLNGLTAQVQNLAVGTSGTDFAIVSATATHTFNLPTASATNRGALSSADWALFTQAYNDKINSAAVTGTTTKTLTLTQQDGGTITASWSDLNTDAVTSVFGRTGAVVAANGDYTTAQVTESGNLYYTEARVNANTNVAANTAARHNAVTLGTANGLSLSTQVLSLGLASAGVTGALSGTDWSTFNNKQNALTLTTTGTSGAATLVGATLNIPQYQAAGTYVSSVTASSPLASSGGTTPNITIQQASGSQSGFLSSTDWTTFNNKQNALGYVPVPETRTITINGTSQDLSANRTYNVGTVTSITATAGTGISISGSPITTSGTLTITNTAPDQVVSLTSSTGISISGTYPNFTITNSSPSSGGTVTSVGLSSATSGVTIGSTPVTTSGTITLAIATASGSQNGLLSSTDWTTFNGKQNALTNPVTGTGNTNYLAKFTSNGSTIGNSALYDGGSFGGFNSTGLGSRTFVINAASGRPLSLELIENANVHSIFFRPNNSGYNLISSNYISGGVYLPLSLSARENNADLVCQTSGNITIGTTTDNGARLQVSGTATFTSTLNASDLITSNSGFRTNATNGYILRNDGNNLNLGGLTRRGFWAGGTAADTQIFAETGYSIFINPGGSSSVGLTLAPSGAATFSSSVGVGGTNTDSLLTINGTAGTTHERFREGSTTIGFIGGANGLITGQSGKLTVRAEAGLVLSSQGNSPDVLITSGNVLIGTTTDNTFSRLQVLGSTWLGQNVNRGVYFADGGSYTSIVGLNQGVSGYNSIELRASGVDGQLFLHTSGNVLIGTTTDNGSKLRINGSIALPHVTKSANYTLDATDYTVGFDCASNRTATLPDATTCSGRIYVIYQYNTGSGARSVTLDGNGSQTINGATTYSLSPYCDFTSVMIQSNGSNWIIIASNLTADCL